MAQLRVQHSPMYGQPKTQIPVPNGTGQKRSRLEMMQADYQKKMIKEKEEKMIRMYEDNQKKAMDRVSRHGSSSSVSSYGSSRSGYSNRSGSLNRTIPKGQVVIEADDGKSVREFFMEQRTGGGMGKNSHSNSPANGTSNGVNHKPPFPTAPVRATHSRPPQGSTLSSAGRDKSRPLQPINRAPKQRVDYNPDRYADITDAPNPPIQMRPQLARPGKKLKEQPGVNGHYDNSKTQEPDLEVDSSIPDRSQLQRLRKQHQQKQQSQNAPEEKKLTDFQKWKMEQDAAKEKRLEDFRRKQREPPASYRSDSEDEPDEADAEIKRKQQELLERIQQQQADLERLRKEREEEDARERKEEEKERKREEAAQRKREALAKARKASVDETDNMDSHRSNSYRNPPSRYEYEESEDERPPPRPPVKAKPPQRKPAKPPQSKPAPKKWEPPASDFEEQPLPSARTDNGVSFYAQAAKEADNERLNLRPCPTCGRKFNADRLEKHRKACTESKKPRKTFDMTKKRVEGTEAQKYARSKDKTDAYYEKKLKKTDWRKQHEGFIQNIQYAKKMTEYESKGGNIASLPPPPPSENPDYVKCPYCERKFNPATAERHIPRCKDIKARPAPPKGKKR